MTNTTPGMDTYIQSLVSGLYLAVGLSLDEIRKIFRPIIDPDVITKSGTLESGLQLTLILVRVANGLHLTVYVRVGSGLEITDRIMLLSQNDPLQPWCWRRYRGPLHYVQTEQDIRELMAEFMRMRSA